MPADRPAPTPAQEIFVRAMVNAIAEDILELGLTASTPEEDEHSRTQSDLRRGRLPMTGRRRKASDSGVGVTA